MFAEMKEGKPLWVNQAAAAFLAARDGLRNERERSELVDHEMGGEQRPGRHAEAEGGGERLWHLGMFHELEERPSR